MILIQWHYVVSVTSHGKKSKFNRNECFPFRFLKQAMFFFNSYISSLENMFSNWKHNLLELKNNLKIRYKLKPREKAGKKSFKNVSEAAELSWS